MKSRGEAGLGPAWWGEDGCGFSQTERKCRMAVSTKAKAGANGRMTKIGPDVTNGAEPDIDLGQPYVVRVVVKGTADLLFHRWNCEAVAEKASAKKGSQAKKTDNVES